MVRIRGLLRRVLIAARIHRMIVRATAAVLVTDIAVVNCRRQRIAVRVAEDANDGIHCLQANGQESNANSKAVGHSTRRRCGGTDWSL